MSEEESVRLDKWLWAARFFKTRSLAKQQVDGGKVHLNDQRTKPSKEVKTGDQIRLWQGWDEKTVQVIAVSGRRGSATVAQALYVETAESVRAREENTARRKAEQAGQPDSSNRPTKKQRRQIHRFRDIV